MTLLVHDILHIMNLAIRNRSSQKRRTRAHTPLHPDILAFYVLIDGVLPIDICLLIMNLVDGRVRFFVALAVSPSYRALTTDEIQMSRECELELAEDAREAQVDIFDTWDYHYGSSDECYDSWSDDDFVERDYAHTPGYLPG